MPSKKKPRPLFEVPVEIGSGGESGWVYRSGAPGSETPAAPAQTTETPAQGIVGESARTLGLALATLAQTFVLVVTIAVIPMTMGMAVVRSLVEPGDTR